MSDSVKAAIEDTAIANGNITHHSMSNILDKHQKRIDESLAKQNKIIDEKLAALTSQLGGQPTSNSNDQSPPPPQSSYTILIGMAAFNKFQRVSRSQRMWNANEHGSYG